MAATKAPAPAAACYDREAITKLVRNADLLFIEAAFARADAALATERAQLTTTAARQIARKAGVRWVEPFRGEDERVQNEGFW